MKIKLFLRCGLIFFTCLSSTSCEDFVDIDVPGDKLVRDQVFQSEETAVSAMRGIYNQLFLASFSNGSTSSVTFLAGLSADNIQNIHTSNLSRMEFQNYDLLPGNPHILDLWSSSYSIIYMTNSFLEGLASANEISSETSARLEGEAKFIRAFTYFYLVNLFGDVPLVLTTDYRNNELASRAPLNTIYLQIVEDLEQAASLLGPGYVGAERTQANRYAAMALLARVHLYLENWEEAEDYSTQVINENGTYQILPDLHKVFLANSMEAIWQISPVGSGSTATHTNEGNLFIIHPIFSFFASVQLENDFLAVFEEQDKRVSEWIGLNQSRNLFYSNKFKIWNSNELPIEEYSMVLRLAEQFLIRAEARAQQDNTVGAIEDLDVIRTRAGLPPLAITNPDSNREDLLDLIIEERRRELFAEWGHRWMDLRRTGRATVLLGAETPFWDETDVLYPIPEAERLKNPNLVQNPGY